MLSLLLRNCSGIQRIRFMMSDIKAIYEKTRKIYQMKKMVAPKTEDLKIAHQKLIQEQAIKFQDVLFEVGREVIFIFTSANQSQNKSQQLSDIISRHTTRIIKSCQPLTAEHLINYIEIIKNMTFTYLSEQKQIQAVYRQLNIFMQTPDHRKVVNDFANSLWLPTTPFQQKIRAVCLLSYMQESARAVYLSKIVPWVQYFKSAQILILLYEKWRYNYTYNYKLLDQIHKNQFFFEMNDINQSYFKLLFIESIRGQFSPGQESIFGKVMSTFQEGSNPLQHNTFNKMIKMLHSQSFFVQSDISRGIVEFNLNNFINIAKNQNYDKQNIALSQMVEIYLGFEVSNSTGEILLNEITFMARRIHFKIDKANFPLYQKLLQSVLKNIEKKLKYERRDLLNKEYTNDTLLFLKQFLPKYIHHWPQVIFQVNNAANELFPPSSTINPLLNTFTQVFTKMVADRISITWLNDVNFTLKLLRFMVQYREIGTFVLPQTIYSTLLQQLLKNKNAGSISNEYLQIFYLCLTLLQRNNQQQKFKQLISAINTSIIEKEIMQEMGRKTTTGIINSLGHNVIWLALCTAKIMNFEIVVNQTNLELFINQKLFYMINSLQYLEVYEVLVMSLKIEGLRPSIYQKLMYNLSTFIIYIGERNSKSTSVFYLNHRYLPFYQKICRLVLNNKKKFKSVKRKDCFKVLQIMLFKKISNFSNDDMLDLMYILGDPSFLSTSIQKIIEPIKFTAFQLEPYSYQKELRSFQYYNHSLLRYYEGKYDEVEIKKRLRGETLTNREMNEYFSKMEVYKTIIMNGDLNIRFEIPKPQTSLTDFKCMYICQRIYQRIKIFNNFDFYDGMNYELNQSIHFKDVELANQKAYIIKQGLIPQIRQDELKIEDRNLPKYIKLQVWKTFVFFDKECAIDPKDLYFNNQMLTDEILTKVVKGVCGSYEKVKEVIKEFSFNEELLNFVQQQKIEHESHGAAIEIKEEGVEQPKFIILSANNVNYKIINICAYLMAKKGFKVVIVKSSQKLQPVMSFLKEYLTSKDSKTKKESDESESEQ